MKISNTLPQFDGYPTLFVVSGEYEAAFIVAKNGLTEEYPKLELNPRVEAMEKQAFIDKSGGTGTGAVSHQERYMEDLKITFQKKLAETISDIAGKEKIKEICIIAPRHAASSFKKALAEEDRRLVHLTIYGIHTRKTTKDIMELYNRELVKANHYITQHQEEYNHKNPAHAIIH